MRVCEQCGAELTRPGAGRFCTIACHRQHQREAKTRRWLESGVAPHAGTDARHYIRLYLFDAQHGLCAICGGADSWQGRPLVFVLDHIDGDASRNHRENLRLVCPNCDSQLPTYKARNRGRGRAWRRARYAAGLS
jgi:hypothetical protein